MAKSKKSVKKVDRKPSILLASLLFGLVIAFQNCAPAPQSSSLNATIANDGTPMSKLTVHLQHEDGVVLSDVELAADDVVDSIDEVGEPEEESESVIVSAPKDPPATKQVVNPTPEAQNSFALELPMGAEKIIVARAKVKDPVSQKIASYYGNAVVTAHSTSGEVVIQMVAIP